LEKLGCVGISGNFTVKRETQRIKKQRLFFAFMAAFAVRKLRCQQNLAFPNKDEEKTI
jgi:hypothetical protein